MRLHQGLNQMENVDSLWLDAGGLPDVPGARHLDLPEELSPLWTRLRRKQWRHQVSKIFAGSKTPYSTPFGWGNPSAFKKMPIPDVWNLHWVSQFLDWEHLLPWMAERSPIVWTLHDLNPLRGLWHYDPPIEELNTNQHRQEQRALAFKIQALARIPKDRLTFVGPSKWMVEQCRQSPMTDGFPVVHIPYGLDTGVFAPRDKRIIRSMFDIPDDVMVLGFVADSIADPRKGMRQLEMAILSLPTSLKVHVLTVGNGRAPAFSFPHNYLGSLQRDHLLSFFYSSCDLFVCPSLQDNLPNTVLEAMACGTPVVAYDTGGLPDMILPGENGAIASPIGSSTDLGVAIESLIADPGRLSEMRGKARGMAVNRYALFMQAEAYKILYSKVTD